MEIEKEPQCRRRSGREIEIGIRPEQLEISGQQPEGYDGTVQGTVRDVAFLRRKRPLPCAGRRASKNRLPCLGSQLLSHGRLQPRRCGLARRAKRLGHRPGPSEQTKMNKGEDDETYNSGALALSTALTAGTALADGSALSVFRLVRLRGSGLFWRLYGKTWRGALLYVLRQSGRGLYQAAIGLSPPIWRIPARMRCANGSPPT